MALSTLIRSHVLKGSAFKSLTAQILRSSSVCTNTNNKVAKPTLLRPAINSSICNITSVGQSAILAKYFNSTRPLQSADGKGHDHVLVWKLERVLSVLLLPLIPVALAAPSTALDTLAAVSIVMHTHWGIEAIVVDYVRPILFGNVVPKIGLGLVYLFSAITLAGLLNLIFNDVGLANTVLQFWKL